MIFGFVVTWPFIFKLAVIMFTAEGTAFILMRQWLLAGFSGAFLLLTVGIAGWFWID